MGEALQTVTILNDILGVQQILANVDGSVGRGGVWGDCG